jgi:pimeloyl-ACP methyl ester carboxylesterase
VVGLDAVTADGTLVHADAGQNPDLLWAARGAGPGFPGVVTRFFLQTYPAPPAMWHDTWAFRLDDTVELLTWLHGVLPRLDRRVVVAWFPVTDLAGLPSDVAEAGGEPDPGPGSREAQLLGAPAGSVPYLAQQASPVTHASADAPPILLMHGAADDLVPPAQSVRLAGALRAAGARAELELVPGASHFWNGASDVAAIVRRSVEFLRTATPGAVAR